jgi:hypothetical protein
MPTFAGGIRRLFAALSVAMLVSILVAGSLSAHEQSGVGEYTFVVGFIHEPAIVEEPNGLDLRVSRGAGDNAELIEGLENTLNAEILFGDQRLPLQLRARYGQPGAYTADIIPTEMGTYSFRIYGDIEGTQVDETFVGGPDTFSEVAGKNAMSFPNQVGTVGSVQSMASDASDTASTAMMFGIGGLIAGLLGLVLGGLAFMKSMAGSRVPSGAVVQDATD